MPYLGLKVKNPPIAGFTWSPDPPQADAEIQFTDTSTSFPDEIVAWSWDFGDGSTSTDQNPVHTYDSAGKYTVTLTITDEDGYTDLDRATLSVKETPVLHDADDGDWEWSAVYSDPVSITLSLTEDELGLQPLQDQAGEPKTVYLEYFDGVDWSLIDEDTLSDPGDADDTLVYTFEVQVGEVMDVPAGGHPIRFRFEGDSLYGGLTQPGTLTVLRETPLVLDADDGDWEWETAYGDEITITLDMMDDDLENLYHQFDEPKTISLERSVGSYWFLVASDVLEDPVSGDAVLGFTFTPSVSGLWKGANVVRFVFDGDSRYLGETVEGTINVLNTPPVANDMEVSTDEDTAIGFFLSFHDVDDEEETLTVSIVDTPVHGAAGYDHMLAPSTFYTPDPNWHGTDSFTFRVTDPDGAWDEGVVTIHVNPVNDPPWSNDGELVTDEDKPVSFMLDYGDIDDPVNDLVPTIVTPPEHGELEWGLPGDEEFHARYTPDPDWFGTDSFTYMVFDGEAYSNVATVTVTVNPVNDPPVAEDDSIATDEDTAVSYNILSNDHDVDLYDVLQARLVTGPNHAESFTLNSDGWFEYVPEENYNSRLPEEEGGYSPDSFAYEVFDGEAYSNVATVYITVLPINDPPVADDQEAETDEDTYVTVTLECSDVDVGQMLEISITNPPEHGLLEVLKPKEDNPFKVRYTPDPNYNGLDGFTYVVSDSEGASDTATVTITVNPVNDLPVAADDYVTTDEDTSVVYNVLDNDDDVETVSLSVNLLTYPAHAESFTLYPDGWFEYVPEENYNSRLPEEEGGYSPDSFTYEVVDDDGASDTATMYITVLPINDPPVADDQEAETDEDAYVTDTLDCFDVDVGQVLTLSITTPPEHGLLEVLKPKEDNPFKVRYTPDPNYNGLDDFIYKVTDSDGAWDEATVTITVNPVNDPPVALISQPLPVDEGTETTLDASGSQDIDGDVIEYRWYFDGAWDTGWSTAPVISHTYYDDGVFEVAVEIRDLEYTDTDTAMITVNDLPPAASFSWTPEPQDEGYPVQFTDASTSHPDEIAAWIWGFAGLGSSSQRSPEFTFPDDGDYTVTLTITDDDGSTDTVSHTVTILNVPPEADAGPDMAEEENIPVTFTGSATDPGSGDTHTYEWDLSYEGAFDIDLSGNTVTHTWTDDWEGTVALKVTDDDGGYDIATLHLTITNVPPVADAGDPQEAEEGSTVTFSGTASDQSPDDELDLNYFWDFGDGSPIIGGTLSPEHTYADDGIYTVALTVEDDDGSVTTCETTVTVNNVAPSVHTGEDQTADEGETVSFEGSFTDPGADSYTFTWDFGDDETASGTLSPTHIYADNGAYTVTLTVEDDDGGVDTDTFTVTVFNVPPEADAGPDMAEEENIPVTFTGSATDTGSGDTHTYEWDLNYDGSTFAADLPGQEVTHTWTDDWEGTVALRVTDDDGGWDIDTLHVTISNVAPEADAGEPQTADEGATVAFSGSASDQSPDDILSYTWDFGDGSPVASGTLSPEHVYADDGTYTVTLTVDDDDDGTTTCTTTVTVINVAPTVNAGEDQTVYVGAAVQFNGQFSDPGDDTHTITWEFGDGGSETGTFEPTHVYASDGDYLVTLTVTDDDGGVGSDELTVHALKIHAAVDFDPDTLNLKSGGNYVTCYIELQEGFTADMIDPTTVLLNGEVPAEPKPVNVGDHDDDGVPDLMVKFSRIILELLLEPGEAETIVTGELYNGLMFDGGDKVTVIAPGKEKPKHSVVVGGEVYGEFKEIKVKQGKQASITLEGGTIYSLFTHWIAAAEAGNPYTLDGDITITSDEGEETAEWSFNRAFPLKWEGPAFDSSSSEPQLIEVIELAVEKVTRLR